MWQRAGKGGGAIDIQYSVATNATSHTLTMEVGKHYIIVTSRVTSGDSSQANAKVTAYTGCELTFIHNGRNVADTAPNPGCWAYYFLVPTSTTVTITTKMATIVDVLQLD